MYKANTKCLNEMQRSKNTPFTEISIRKVSKLGVGARTLFQNDEDIRFIP